MTGLIGLNGQPMRRREPPKMILDMRKVYKSFPCGQITLHLSWTQDDRQPCMVLLPTMHEIHHEKVTPCIIKLENAWRWDENTGSGRYCATNTASFCVALGFEVTAYTCFKITDIIREHLGDLLSCPPMPMLMDQHEVAIATIRDHNTGQTHQSGITEDV